MDVLYSPEQATAIRHSNTKKLIWGMVCLLGPTILLLLTIATYVLVGFTTAQTDDGSSTVSVFTNIISYLVGIIVLLTWLPGIIVGIILLSKRQKI